MNDTFDPILAAKGFFFPSANPNVDAATRKQIALAMMARGRRAFPKNLGEGIASIGENIGDALAYRGMLAENAEENKAGDEFKSRYTGITPQAAVAPLETTPPESMPPAVAAAGVAPPTPPIVPPPPPRARVVTPAPIPPPNGQLGNRGDTVFPTPNNGLVQPQQALPPPLPAQAATPPIAAPVMAQGGAPAAVPPDEEARRGVAHALLRQQMGGAPPPASAAPPRPTVADFGQPSALAPTPQAIPAAPPQPQVRAMPPPQVAQGPQIVDPGPEPTPPRTMTDLQRQILQDIDKEPPSRRAGARAAVEPILQQEQAKIAQEQAIYQDKMKTRHEFKKLQAEQTYNAPKEAALTAKTLQDIKKGEEPTLREDVETKHVYNPETRQYEAPKIAGADPNKKPAFKGSEFQGKTLGNLGRAIIADEGLKGENEKLLTNSPWSATVGSLPYGVGRGLRTDAYKEADTHAENFVQAFIRQQSGAGYSVAELEAEARSMLPRYGDTEKQLQSKREQREQFISSAYGIVGPSGQKGLDIDAAKRAAERERSLAAEKEKNPEAKADPLEGREALLPDKTIVVRRNGKWVPK